LGRFRGLRFFLLMYVVTDIGALHPKDHVFRDVRGVVGNPFEISRHK
jgi:hypothetical protein